MGSKGTIIVTGANGGLGSAIVQNIVGTPDLASNYTGVYAVRKVATAAQLQAALSRAPSNHKHEAVDLDLGSVEDVRKVATDINAKVAKGELPKIRALILNAGYQDHTDIVISEDGFEMSWQVNFLSNLILSLLLLQSMDEQEGRILVIGSWAHNIDDKRNDVMTAYKDPRYTTLYPGVDALAKGEWSRPEEDPTTNSGFRRYGASKLCAIMLCKPHCKGPQTEQHLPHRLGPWRHAHRYCSQRGFLLSFVVMKLVLPTVANVSVWMSPNGMLRTARKSAADVIRACFELEAHRGEALHLDGSATGLEIAKEAKDEAKRKEVWEYGLKAAHIEEGDTVLVDWK
ncbi:hypothetical protein TrVFT333_007344 [Trichoderma virens FT-333]|nr:hypothetical protein TrVFT333_007344 [Trichoderma virens FT-333]